MIVLPHELPSLGEVSIEEGGMWEERGWKVGLFCGVPLYESAERPCPHCAFVYAVDRKSYNGSIYRWHYAVCPRVIIAKNEGGFSTTGVCLDCVLGSAEGIGRTVPERPTSWPKEIYDAVLRQGKEVVDLNSSNPTE